MAAEVVLHFLLASRARADWSTWVLAERAKKWHETLRRQPYFVTAAEEVALGPDAATLHLKKDQRVTVLTAAFTVPRAQVRAVGMQMLPLGGALLRRLLRHYATRVTFYLKRYMQVDESARAGLQSNEVLLRTVLAAIYLIKRGIPYLGTQLVAPVRTQTRRECRVWSRVRAGSRPHDAIAEYEVHAGNRGPAPLTHRDGFTQQHCERTAPWVAVRWGSFSVAGLCCYV